MVKGWTGVARRPVLPNAGDTIQFTRDYIVLLGGAGILNIPIFKHNLIPTIHINHLNDVTTADHFNRYAAYMKRLRKNRAEAGA